jgi:hypothetical protein
MNKYFSYYKVHFTPEMHVVRSTQNELNEDKLIFTAWTFAYTALWNGINFSPTETGTAKRLISDLFIAADNRENHFVAFCERVLLARKYVTAYTKRFIPLPSVWLNKENATGFAGTKKWYEDICSARHSVPSYKCESKRLAQAVLCYGILPTALNYQTHRQELISQGEHDLLIIFQLYVLNFEKSPL